MLDSSQMLGIAYIVHNVLRRIQSLCLTNNINKLILVGKRGEGVLGDTCSADSNCSLGLYCVDGECSHCNEYFMWDEAQHTCIIRK